MDAGAAYAGAGIVSLKAMADRVRAEQARAKAAAPAALADARRAEQRQWKERKRRAFERAIPLFREAFGRDFSPHRFTYEDGEINTCQCVIVSINYEGKLYAYVRVVNGERSQPNMYIRPMEGDAHDEKRVGYYGNLADEVGKRIVEWGLA